MSPAITRKITSAYRTASAEAHELGNDWYTEAYALCVSLADETGHAIDNIIVAFSHLSPRVQYVRNVVAIKALARGEHKPNGIMARSWLTARNALMHANPWETFSKRASKTREFAKAIAGDTNAIVVDVWAARVAGCAHMNLGSPAQYEIVANAYRRAARRLGISVRELQAITWVHSRGRAA